MPKDAYYFPHDSNASQDPKILQMCSEYQATGYGWYWMIIELMREQEGYKLPINGKYTLNAYARRMYADPERFAQFIDDCVNEFHLFNRNDDYLWSESLCRRMRFFEEKSKQARQAALKRWGRDMPPQSNSKATALQTHSGRNASKVKYSKVNIYTNNKGFEEFWNLYPKKKSKGQAEKAFAKINPDDELLVMILCAIEKAKKSKDWLKDNGQFIPYPATWLNAKGWEDEIVDNKSKPHTAQPGGQW